jgi:hypothetical protein
MMQMEELDLPEEEIFWLVGLWIAQNVAPLSAAAGKAVIGRVAPLVRYAEPQHP